MAAIALVEDDPRYLAMVADTLRLLGRHQVVARFHDGADALHEAQRLTSSKHPPPWSLLITDLQMPRVDGLACTQGMKARFPDIPVLVLTAFEDPARICQAIACGADGYILKDASPDQLLEHVTVALAGGSPLTPAVARHILKQMRTQLSNPAQAGSDPSAELSRPRLTGRERDVLRCLVMGQAYKEVAGSLGISIDTVRTHIRGLYRKLRVQNVGAAVAKGIRDGLV
ncbi:MAG: response regulator transcription factor [Oligoflexia bacterium]|nr:response regulator transcription factor [Oligoflexia bacterium]